MKVEANTKPKNINLIIGRRQCGKTNKLIKAVLKNLITAVYDFTHQMDKSLNDLSPQFLVLVNNPSLKNFFEQKIRFGFSEQALKVVDKILVVSVHNGDPVTLMKIVRETAAGQCLQTVSIDDWPVQYISYLKEVNDIVPQAFFNVIVWDKKSDQKDYEEMSR